MRRPGTLLLLAALLLGTLATAPQASATAKVERWRAKMLDFVNDYRVDYNLKPLRETGSVSKKAQWHSIRMARRSRVFHTQDLERKLATWDPTMWGENVGAAGSIWGVFRQWQKSAPHNANLLRRGYRRTGIGIVRARGLYWITMIFYG